jgi:hypothetical protein
MKRRSHHILAQVRGSSRSIEILPVCASIGFALLLSSFAAPLHAARILDYETTLTLFDEGLGAGLPASVTVAASGEICVTDNGVPSVHLYNGRNVAVFRSNGIAAFTDPMDVTIDAQGRFVCTDARPGSERTIRRLNFFGEPEAFEPQRPEGLWMPEHLTILSDGNYLTTDPSCSSLLKHDAVTGALIWKKNLVESGGSEILGLGRPAEGPDGKLYVPLGGDRMVEVLSAEGEPVANFGVTGTGRGRFIFPVGVAFCPDGTIAVLDRMRAVVELYDSSYNFVGEVGEIGAGQRNLYQPVSIAAAADGQIYVVQGFLARIQVFRYSNSDTGCLETNRPRLLKAGIAGAADAVPGGEGGPMTVSPGSVTKGRSHLIPSDPLIRQDHLTGGC